MKELLRKYKIALLLNKKIGDEFGVILFIQQVLDTLEIRYSDNYPYKIFYFIDDKLYFEMFKDIERRKVGWLWCRYPEFWEVMKNEYHLKYDDISYLIEYLFSEYTSYKVVGKPCDLPIMSIDMIVKNF